LAEATASSLGSPDVPSTGPQASRARSEVREIMARKGHAVEVARGVIARLERAIAEGVLTRTPFLDAALDDLRVALAQDRGQKLGGKSAEASRFILRAIDRELDEA
jgi:hypothetical protein